MGESVTFGDTKEGTFALRLHPQLQIDGPVGRGRFLSSAGVRNQEVWGTRSRWLAAFGPINGREVTVAVLDHPSNPRHPTWWHARAYGLLAANPFGVHDFEGEAAGTGDLIVEAGRPLELAYRVVLALGAPDTRRLESVWRQFADS